MDDGADLIPEPEHTPSGVTGEALLAVTGVARLLVPKPLRITVSDKESAARLGRDIRRALRAFLENDLEAQKIPPQPAFSYKKALDEVTEGAGMFAVPDPDDPIGAPTGTEKIVAMFRGDDNELALGYVEAAKRVVLYLQSILPVRLETTMAKSVNVDPSDTEIARFRRAWNVANDPMIVLRDMSLGILVSDQIKHLSLMFPATWEAMKTTAAAEMGRSMAAKKSWKLTWRQNRLMGVLLQQPTFNSALTSDLQGTFDKKPDQQKGPPPVNNPSKAAGKLQTSTQAIADGSAS